MRTAVLARLSISAGESATVTEIDRRLNGAYLRTVVDQRLSMSQADLVTVAGDPLVDLPDDCAEILAIVGAGEPLTPLTRAQGIAGDLGYVQESPSRLRLIPTPTVTTTAGPTLYYAVRPDPMVGDTDEPSEVPAEFHDLLVEMAVSETALAEEEPGLSQAADLAAANLRRGLARQVGRRGGPTAGRILIAGYGPR